MFIVDGTQPANPTETQQLDVSIPDVSFDQLQGTDGDELTGADGAPLLGPGDTPQSPDGSSWFPP